MKLIVRIHTDETTVDIEALDRQAALDIAEHAVQRGVWVKNKLLPPARIVYIEVLE